MSGDGARAVAAGAGRGTGGCAAARSRTLPGGRQPGEGAHRPEGEGAVPSDPRRADRAGRRPGARSRRAGDRWRRRPAARGRHSADHRMPGAGRGVCQCARDRSRTRALHGSARMQRASPRRTSWQRMRPSPIDADLRHQPGARSAACRAGDGDSRRGAHRRSLRGAAAARRRAARHGHARRSRRARSSRSRRQSTRAWSPMCARRRASASKI